MSDELNEILAAPVAELTGLLKGLVDDVTSPELQQQLATLSADAVRIGLMRAKGASEADVEDATADLKARAESLANVPGLIAANKQVEFLNILGGVLNTGIGFAFGAARTAMGLPPVPAPGV